jgi:hypothetical protein
MANGPKLLSGRVPVTPYSDLNSDRYQFLGLGEAEPSLGAGNANSVLTLSTINTRVWSNSLSIDSLNVTSNASLGNVGNVHITGGLDGQILKTDGNGNLSWTSSSTSGQMPYYIPSGDSYTVDNYKQGLFALPIDVEGTLEVDGQLVQVDYFLPNTIIDGQLIYRKDYNLTGNNGLLFYDSNTTLIANNFKSTSSANLGSVSNIVITGGTNGYVLTTDGAGNLSWASPGGGYTAGTGLGLYPNNQFYISNTAVTSGSYGNGDTVATFTVNSQGQLTAASNTAITANAANLTGTTLNSSIVTSSLTSVGTLGSLSVTNKVTAGQLQGDGGNISNIQGANVTGNVANANYAAYAGNVVNSSQSNITSLGTLTGLTVGNLTANTVFGNGTINATGNANVGNLGFGSGIVTGTGNITAGNVNAGNLLTTNNLSVTTYVTSSLIPNANITYSLGNSTNRWKDLWLSNSTLYFDTNSTMSAGTVTNGNSNISIPVANGNVNFSSAGNANILVVTGTGANITGTANISGNANVGNLGTNIAIITTGNITTINSGLLQNGNSNITITANSNVTTTVSGNSTLIVTDTGANITGTLNASGNANVGNIGAANGVFTNVSGNGSALSSITGANVTGQVANALVAGTVYTNAQPNITSVGTLSSLDVTANINAGNVKANSFFNGTSNIVIAVANGNVVTNANGNSIMTITGTGANINGTANIVGNANVGNLGAAAGVFTANITATNANITGQYVSTLATGTAPFVVTSTTQVANLSVATAGLATYATTANSVAGYNVSGAVAYATTANSVAGANVSGTVSSATTAGTVTTNAQPNITSVGTLTSLTVTNNILAGNANVTGQFISTVADGTPPLVINSTTLVSNLNANALQDKVPSSSNTATTIALRDINGNLSANFFIGNGSQLTGIITSVSNISNGNSNLNIPSANGNVTISAAGNANILVITGTGANVTGYANISGNANVGNLGFGSGIVTGTGNITAGNLIGTIAAGSNSITTTGNISGANVTITANLIINATAKISANSSLGTLGQTLVAQSDGTVQWADKFYVGALPPDNPNYGDIWFYVDNSIPIAKLYMWVTDGGSSFFYDFLP